MFNLDQLVSDCHAVLHEDRSQKFIRDIVARAVSDPGAVLTALGEPNRAELKTLYRAHDLTVLNVIWAPWMTLLPHNHQMWAVIGIYTGREDNIYWRRTGQNGRRIEAAGARALSAKDAEPLGRDIIHSVTNPIPRVTAAIHVYGGDYFAPGRSEWDPETLIEQPCDPSKIVGRFAGANAALGARKRR